MPLPIAPIAVTAVRVAPVAVAAYVAWRNLPKGRRDQHVEDAMDDLPDGLTQHRDAQASRASARFRRTLRLGRGGPGFEVEFAALGRFRIRKI